MNPLDRCPDCGAFNVNCDCGYELRIRLAKVIWPNWSTLREWTEVHPDAQHLTEGTVTRYVDHIGNPHMKEVRWGPSYTSPGTYAWLLKIQQ